MDIKTLCKQDVNTRIAHAFRKGKDSQKSLNAIITAIDEKTALQSLANVKESAPLYGVPYACKDNVNTRGIKTTASSQLLANYIPIYNAHIIEKLQEAGCVCMFKASMDELGMGGTNINAIISEAHNPWDNNRITGGSSGGSAALVAQGVVPFAIGTDTGDSVRKPAAYNGVIGIKPTYGRISRYGIIPYASSLDHVGYFTTSIQDAAQLLEVLAGRDDRDMTSSFKPVPQYLKQINKDLHGKTIAIIDTVQAGVKAPLQANFDQITAGLEKRGAKIKHYTLNEELMKVLVTTYHIIANAEAAANHSNLDGVRLGVKETGESIDESMMLTRTKGFSSYVRKRFLIGSFSLFEENQEKIFRKAQKVRRKIVNAVNEIFKEADIIMASASGDIAPLIKDSHDATLHDEEAQLCEHHMVIANFNGFPSMSVPSGFVAGMPVGINFTAKAFDEQTLFDVGAAMEDITGLSGNDVEVKL